jgi:hypothetical protein
MLRSIRARERNRAGAALSNQICGPRLRGEIRRRRLIAQIFDQC